MIKWSVLLLLASGLSLPSMALGSPAAPSVVGQPFAQPLVSLNGAPLDAAAVRGKVVLVVNVASHCGYTKQYAGLQTLHDRYAAKGFTVLGVPCNQFAGQEPGSAEQIGEFCKKNYGVSFPLLEKQQVNGKDRAALYQALVGSPAGEGKDIGWNFEKFVVGKDGTVLGRFPSRVDPLAPEITALIEKALK